MRLLTVKVPEHYLEAIDELVKQGIYYNRSDAVRDAIRRLLIMYRRNNVATQREKSNVDVKVIEVDLEDSEDDVEDSVYLLSR